MIQKGRQALSLGLLVLVCVLPAQAARNLSFAIIGDAGEWNASAAAVQKSIAAGQVSNLILPGDNLYHPEYSYSQVWSHWSQRGFRFSIVALGNHYKTYASEMEYFRMPGEYYARTDGAVRFVVLNSDNVKTADEQARFLEQQLTRAREPLLFVVYHHPSYTINKHRWEEKREFQLRIRPLLKKYHHRITALIVGHDHIASLIELGDIPMIVSGAVFESLPASPVDYVEDGVRVRTRWLFRGGYYWTRLDVDGTTGDVWVNYVNSDRNQVACSVRIAPRPMLARPNCAQKLAPAL
jgi:hypothetical protein